jgi:nucleoside-diphosphate-sugar epimerase
MRVFLTGGTGFIGSHFIKYAIQNGLEVTALRRIKSSIPKIALIKQPKWLEKGIEDVTTADIKGCDILVHLAAHSANVPYDTLENCIYWNVNVPITLFRKAVKAGVSKFVVAGSCFEYGCSGAKYDFIPIDAPLEPTLSYPASKAMASIAFSQLVHELNIKVKIFRIFQVFGEGEPENRLWPSLKKASELGEDFYMTAGEQIRDFINVTEVGQKFVLACEEDWEKKQYPLIRNLGTGQAISIREFAEYWWKKWNSKGQIKFGECKYRKGEVMRYVPKI